MTPHLNIREETRTAKDGAAQSEQTSRKPDCPIRYCYLCRGRILGIVFGDPLGVVIDGLTQQYAHGKCHRSSQPWTIRHWRTA